LTQLLDTNLELQDILRRTQICATEEVILPTLVALLGFTIAANPCGYDYVKFREPYTLKQTDTALLKQDVYWMHSVPRRYAHGIRKRIRERCNHYEKPFHSTGTAAPTDTVAVPDLLLTWPILTRMQSIGGWLEEDEAHLLIDVAARALTDLPTPHAVVEVGSYCGRAIVVLGSVARIVCPEAKVYTIDPQDGRVGLLVANATWPARSRKARSSCTGTMTIGWPPGGWFTQGESRHLWP
jgi:hypothetical protein